MLYFTNTGFDLNIIIIAITLVFIDFIYLKLVSNHFSNQIKIIQGSTMQINYVAAIVCYILLVFGIYYFIIKPNRTVLDAFFLGIIIYGVFETTNMALFSKWSWITVLIDTLWGGILFTLTTFIVKSINL